MASNTLNPAAMVLRWYTACYSLVFSCEVATRAETLFNGAW